MYTIGSERARRVVHIRDLFVSYYNYRFIILLGDYHSDNKHQRNLLACDSILKKRPATTAYMDGSYRRVPGYFGHTLYLHEY